MTQLLDYLRSTGKTQSELAADLGVEPSTITRIVRGERKPSPELARRISAVTGVSLEALRPDIYGPAPSPSEAA